ncbi:hypothetical protein OAA_13810 [Vibrio cyclitrophicus 1F175]|nr:hypothetical protein OAA_13810 [Vibrio cyclitrophicus 1F175]
MVGKYIVKVSVNIYDQVDINKKRYLLMTNFYDVCNDYSIDKRSKPKDLDNYRTINRELEGQKVTLYVHKKNGELHYASSTEPLTLKYVH